MSNNINIGGYDDNAFYDCLAVNHIGSLFLETGYIMPHFAAEDKTPNLDGYFEICKEAVGKKIPSEKFEVQIKSLNHDYRNSNKKYNTEYAYKYSCETKAMNVVMQGITKNPVLLLLVDVPNKALFWKHLTVQYCLQLKLKGEEHKTIYFDESDRITDMSVWTTQLRQIYHENEVRLSSPEQNSFILSEVCRTVPPEAQDAFDYLNGLMDGELWFIKKYFFPTVWKFGIAYCVGDEKNFNCIGVYRIERGENDYFIKMFDENDSKIFTAIYFGGTYSIMEIVRKIVEEMVEKFFKRDNYYFELFPDKVIEEILFDEIDHVLTVKAMEHRQKGQSRFVFGLPKNEITLEEAQELIDKEQVGILAQNCLDELVNRGYTVSKRPWSKLTDFYISKEEEGCISFKEYGDVEENNKSNIRLIFGGFMEFYQETKKRLDTKSDKLFGMKNHYQIAIRDDFSGCCYMKTESREFQMEWLVDKENGELGDYIRNSHKNPPEGYAGGGSCLLTANCSWYRMWMALCKNLALKYIGVNESVSLISGYLEMI